MITLSAASTTTIQDTFNGLVKTTTTDTLFVSYAELDFASSAIMAIIQRGTMVGTPPAFVPNMPSLRVQLNADGTFASTDGTWTGTTASAPALIAALKSMLDNFVLGSGKVTGTAV
jgi:hypothetical protein